VFFKIVFTILFCFTLNSSVACASDTSSSTSPPKIGIHKDDTNMNVWVSHEQIFEGRCPGIETGLKTRLILKRNTGVVSIHAKGIKVSEKEIADINAAFGPDIRVEDVTVSCQEKMVLFSFSGVDIKNRRLVSRYAKVFIK
jgi:hypothetical protein